MEIIWIVNNLRKYNILKSRNSPKNVILKDVITFQINLLQYSIDILKNKLLDLNKRIDQENSSKN